VLVSRKSQPQRFQAAGFTIVELMIATMVFSVIMLIVATVVIAFSRSYYGATNAAHTQETTRTTIDAVSQSIQFGSQPFSPGISSADTSLNYFCAGGYLFAFNQGVRYDGAAPTNTNAGLYMLPVTSACAVPATLTGGRQLLGKDMRVMRLTVSPVAGDTQRYQVSATLAYGNDNDLFCKVGDACPPSAPLTNEQLVAAGPNLACITGTGAEYCAVSSLTTVVQKRT